MFYTLFCNNTEVVPAGVASCYLRRNAANDGWEFVAVSPGASSLVQTSFVEQTTNTTTGSGSFVDLGAISITLTTSTGTSLLIHFDVSGSNASQNTNVDFQLVIDGTPVRGCATRNGNAANSPVNAALTYKKTGLAAGPHTVKIQWRTGGGTARVAPGTTITEHASLLIEEVTV